jgi:hypothetical protein
LERRTFATIFAAEMNLVILKCPLCAAKYGSELGACQECGQRTCPQCYLLLKDEEIDCPHCGFHAGRPCPGCKADVGLGLAECPNCHVSLCPTCGNVVGENDIQCQACGTELELCCPRCGEELTPEMSKCPGCGEEFAG